MLVRSLFSARNWTPAAPPASGYRDLVMSLAPSAYWRLGESAGTSAADESGNSHTGTYVNTPTLGVAGCLTSDADTAVSIAAASSEYINISGYTILSAAVTYILWVKKATGFTDWGAIESATATTGSGIYLWNSDQINWGVQTTSVNYDSAGVIHNGNWHMIAGTWDGSNLRTYLDGSLVAGPTAASVTLTGTHNVKIGQYGSNSGTYNDATVDEAAVWAGTALSGANISALYTAATT